MYPDSSNDTNKETGSVHPNDTHTSANDSDASQVSTQPKQKHQFLYVCSIIVLLVSAAGLAYFLQRDKPTQEQTGTWIQAETEIKDVPNAENPFTQTQTLGDGKVTTVGPKKGYVYACTNNFRQAANAHIGNWVDGDHWEPSQKMQVLGAVEWPSAFVSITTQGSTRVISSNGLPDHRTGTFPISRSDPAFQIDPNPNAISAQDVMYTLPITPNMAASPRCTTRGAIGVMTNGVLLYNALDDAGKDAVAHEVQDICAGHPQKQGAYHYHGYSFCLPSMSASEIIGYALDGYGITGPQKSDGTYYTTDDLDECHGTTSTIRWEGEDVEMYHYVMTADYPYSIGCFKGIPVRN